MGCKGLALRTGRRHVVVFGFAAALGLALIGFSQVPAASANPFTGNTPLTIVGLDGTYNFSVFSASAPAIAGIAPSFTAGSGSPALSSAGFIYLYQPVNDGVQTGDVITKVNQKLGLPGNNSPLSPSSWGFFDHQVFCTSSPCSTVVGPGTPLPTSATPSFVTNTASINPTGVSLFGSTLQATYAGVHGTGMEDPGTSSLLAFTSPLGPQFDLTGGTITDGTHTASGNSPDPAPEPSTLLLSAIAFGAAFAPLTRGRLRWHRQIARAS